MIVEAVDKLPADTLRDKARSSEFRRSTFREEYHEAIRAVLPSLLADYITDIKTTDDPEVRRKGIAYFSQMIGVEAEKKQDVGATRAVVTINFGGTSRAAIPQVIISEDIVQEVIKLGEPSQAMMQHLYVNDELSDDDS